MRKLLSTLVMFAACATAQTLIRINVGGQPTGAYSGDSVCGGIPFTVPSQAGIYSTLKYGPSFSCDVPAPNGSCVATLDLIENRAAGPNPATDSGIATRVFTVSLQGIASAAIDIFAAAGALMPYQLALPVAAVTDGHLRFSFVAMKGNAVLSGLDISCTPPPPVVLGVSCASLVPTIGIAIVIKLPDGSCLPITLLAAPGFIADNVQAVWFTADKAGEVNVQSLFTTLTPIPQ